MLRSAFCCIAAAAVLAAGCAADTGDGDGTAAAETSAAVRASADTGLVKGTPAGGLNDWVGEIEAGIDGIVARAETDLAGARATAVKLYATRQEYLEMYWGTSGRLSGPAPELGEAVMAAEAKFHDLMLLLNAQTLDRGAAGEAEKALLERYRAVREVGEASSVPLVPPGNAPAGGGA